MKSLRVTATLDASCDFIYRFFLDSRLHADVTGSPAQIEGKAGGKFSAWDAYITGEINSLHQDFNTSFGNYWLPGLFFMGGIMQ